MQVIKIRLCNIAVIILAENFGWEFYYIPYIGCLPLLARYF